MTIQDYFRELKASHPQITQWFSVASDRTSHHFDVVHGVAAKGVGLASRRFYSSRALHGSVTTPGVCLVGEPLLQGLHQSPCLLSFLEAAQQSRKTLTLVAPGFSDEVLATLAINDEKSVLKSLPLVAGLRHIEWLSQTLGVPVSTEAALKFHSTVPIREVIATAHESLILGQGETGTVPVGLIRVGGLTDDEARTEWTALREILEQTEH